MNVLDRRFMRVPGDQPPESVVLRNTDAAAAAGRAPPMTMSISPSLVAAS